MNEVPTEIIIGGLGGAAIVTMLVSLLMALGLPSQFGRHAAIITGFFVACLYAVNLPGPVPSFWDGEFWIGIFLLGAQMALTATGIYESLKDGRMQSAKAVVKRAAKRVKNAKNTLLGLNGPFEADTPVAMTADIPLDKLPEPESKFVLYDTLGQNAGTLKYSIANASLKPPVFRPVFAQPDLATNAIDPYLADTGVMGAEAAQRIIGWKVEDPETGEEQFVTNDDGRKWLEADKMEPVPAVSGKVSKFPSGRSQEAMKAAIKDEPPPGC